jgi:flagellin FlaB
MKVQRKSLTKDEQAFTGLEAAIVLTAFIVVAAVFSYMVLGAGFFSTEKAKAVVHSGVEQATSSVETSGDVIGVKGGSGNLSDVIIYVGLTAGENPIDMTKLTLTYTDAYIYDPDLTMIAAGGALSNPGEWNYTWVADRSGDSGDGDNMLDTNEQARVWARMSTGAGGTGANNEVLAYQWFQMEIKPDMGGVLAIRKTVPGALDTYTPLY